MLTWSFCTVTWACGVLTATTDIVWTYDYAISIGVEIHFDHRVDGYFEDREKGNAGVIVRGEKIKAELIIAADGVKSQARHY